MMLRVRHHPKVIGVYLSTEVDFFFIRLALKPSRISNLVRPMTIFILILSEAACSPLGTESFLVNWPPPSG